MQSLAQQRWGRAAGLCGGDAWRSGGAPLAAFVALGAVLRFATLDVQSFWRDEALTVSELGGSLRDALRNVAHQEATPPLYSVRAWLWTRVAGTGEVGVPHNPARRSRSRPRASRRSRRGASPPRSPAACSSRSRSRACSTRSCSARTGGRPRDVERSGVATAVVTPPEGDTAQTPAHR